MRIAITKEDFIPLSISALALGPCFNFYFNDILQYVYGGSSVSAIIYVLMALIGVRSYSFLLRKNKSNKAVKNTILLVLVLVLFSFLIHPSIGDILIAPDLNPLKSIALFLLFYGFPLMIYCSMDTNWDLVLWYLFLFSIVVVVLAGLDYLWVMLRISLDDVNYMSFSYNQLLAASVCAVYGYKKRMVWPFVISFYSLVLIFFGGARGSLGALLILYLLLISYPFSVRRILIVIGIGLILVIGGQLLLSKFLSSSADFINEIGGFSRTLYKITEGDLFQSDSRDNLSIVIINAIGDNPLGYGLLGDRYLFKLQGWSGYAHNIILELTCDFGWFLGPAIFIWWITKIARKIIEKKKQDSFFVFMAMLPVGCLMLFFSGSFVEEFIFWALLGLLYNKNVKSITN